MTTRCFVVGFWICFGAGTGSVQTAGGNGYNHETKIGFLGGLSQDW